MAMHRITAPVQQTVRRLFRQAQANATPGKADLAPLAPQGNAYVRTVLLPNVGDLARPDDVWEEKHWGQRSGIKAVIEQLGYRQGSKHWVSASVELVLPAETVQHDRRLGGQLATSLAQALTALHNHDFLNRLPEGLATARYTIREATDLLPGQARVRLGPAVHVAAPGESMVWRIEHSTDGVIWQPTAELGQQQRLFILAGQDSLGTQTLPDWPLPPECGLVILNHPGEAELEFSAEPIRSLRITPRPDLGCHMVQASQSEPQGALQGARLFIRAARLQALELPTEPAPPMPVATIMKAARPSPVRQEPVLEPVAPPSATPSDASTDADVPTLMHRPVHTVPEDAPTLYAASPPQPSPTLELEGLALQRPSAFSGTGVKAVHWGLDAQGAVVPPDAPTRQLRFTVGEDDCVRVATPAGERVLALLEPLPLPGTDTVLRLQPLPAELAAHYIAWLPLPSPLHRRVPLATGATVTVGRQLQTMHPLRPMSGPGFLAGTEPGTSGERMGLSRQHLALCAGAEGLEVRPLGQATVAHLDENLNLIKVADSSSPALLAPGDCMVVGHYVWRYRHAGTSGI